MNGSTAALDGLESSSPPASPGLQQGNGFQEEAGAELSRPREEETRSDLDHGGGEDTDGEEEEGTVRRHSDGTVEEEGVQGVFTLAGIVRRMSSLASDR